MQTGKPCKRAGVGWQEPSCCCARTGIRAGAEPPGDSRCHVRYYIRTELYPLRCRDTREIRGGQSTRETPGTSEMRTTSLAGQLTPIRTKAEQQFPLRGDLHVGCLLPVTHWVWPLLASSTCCIAYWVGLVLLSCAFEWSWTTADRPNLNSCLHMGLHIFRWVTCLSVGLP